VGRHRDVVLAYTRRVRSYDVTTYGESIAQDYDELYAGLDPAPAVAALADLAAGGRALELGIGTGRVSLPLAARGVEVVGIDASESMIARLRAKPGSGGIRVVPGDFAAVDVEGTFSLVFVVFNTFFALVSQEEQLRCFENVAARLAPGGVFVIEAFVPDPARFTQGQVLQAARGEADRVVIEATRHDRASQTLDAQLVALSAEGTRLYPVHLRYAWPSELDLMAKLAGLRLRERWAGWGRGTFGPGSSQHVSLYERGSPETRPPRAP
jgi:SAM-dependent methyltransferase